MTLNRACSALSRWEKEKKAREWREFLLWQPIRLKRVYYIKASLAMEIDERAYAMVRLGLG